VWNKEKGLPSFAQISSEGLAEAEAEHSPLSPIDQNQLESSVSAV